jgi:hypothetical protein
MINALELVVNAINAQIAADSLHGQRNPCGDRHQRGCGFRNGNGVGMAMGQHPGNVRGGRPYWRHAGGALQKRANLAPTLGKIGGVAANTP